MSRGLSFSHSYFAQVYMDSRKGGRAGGRSGGATDQGMGHNRHLRSARRLVYLWHGAYKRPGIVAARPRLPPAAAGDTRRRADAAWFGGEGGWGAARSVLCRCHQRRGQRGRRRHGGGRRATRPPTAAAGHWHLCLPCTRRLGRAPCAGILQWPMAAAQTAVGTVVRFFCALGTRLAGQHTVSTDSRIEPASASASDHRAPLPAPRFRPTQHHP